MFNMESLVMFNTDLGAFGAVKSVFQTWIFIFFRVRHGGRGNGHSLYIRYVTCVYYFWV
jgi:hypothetical protein